MELNKKLQELRKKKGLTQEEVAESLYVSRTAISKWESGRGYPSVDSLKALARFYSVTVDALLSGEELLTIAEEDVKQKETHFRDLVFGLMDCSIAMFFFLPFFRQTVEESIQSVSLVSLAGCAPWLKTVYFAAATGMILFGILTLALQNCRRAFWVRHKSILSLLLNGFGSLLFIVSLQPYAAAFLFVFLMIKGIMILKRS